MDETVGTHLLVASNLHKSFGGVRAVNGVSLTIDRGAIVGLIGPNGAGKTTLFSLLAGEHRPDAGFVLLDGRDITGWSPHRICASGVARTFQVVRPFLTMTTFENVLVGAHVRATTEATARRLAEEMIDFVGLTKVAHVNTRELTIAARKRLEIARALASQPALLLLDEVFAGLTPSELVAAMSLVRAIAERGVTLLLIEHVMQVVMSLAERIVVLHQGEELASGPPHEIARNPLVVEAYLGEEYLSAQA